MDGGFRFVWNTHNIAYLALHGVRPEEAEQVLAGDLIDLDYGITPYGEQRWTAVGQTHAAAFSLLSGLCSMTDLTRPSQLIRRPAAWKQFTSVSQKNRN